MNKIAKFKYIAIRKEDLSRNMFNKIINIGSERWFCEDNGESEYRIMISEILNSMDNNYFTNDEKDILKTILDAYKLEDGSFGTKDEELCNLIIFE